MTQPIREHRHDIHPRLCLSFGIVSDILWRQAPAYPHLYPQKGKGAHYL